MSLIKQSSKDLYKELIKNGIKEANKQIFTKAEIYFQKAIELDKKTHIAYINLSNIYIIKNEINKGIKLLMEYIQKNSFDEIILNHTAKILYNYKYKKDLLNLFKKIDLKSKKNFKKKYYLYFIQGLYYEGEEMYNNAEKAYHKSISSNKFHFNSYIKLFNLYERKNKLNKFKTLLTKGFNNFDNKDHKKLLILYKSLILNRENKFYDSQKIIDDNNLYLEFKKNKNFLIKILDIESKNNEKLKEYNLAFEKIQERNETIFNLDKNKKFDGNKIYNSIDKYKIFYKKKNVEKINSKLSYHDDKNLVFLVGFPRSGTTLLDSILRSHSKITVLEEKPYLLNLRHNFFNQNNNDLSSLLNITQNIKDKIRTAYFKKIMTHTSNNKDIIVDKFPLTIIELGFVKCIFPNAKIILAMRHPCDVIISCFFSSFKINDAMINFLNINDTIKFYDKVFDLFEFYSKELNFNFLTIKYEDIINDLKHNVGNITNFIGLKYESNMENFFITARNRSQIFTPSYSQVISPLYSSSIGRWKNYSNSKQLQQNLNKWIKKFNY